MNDQWTERLSEYLDGDLAAAHRAALERHLETCAPCRATLAELRRVVARAQALDDTPPARELWPGIAQRIGATPSQPAVVNLAERRARRRFSFSMPALAAAAIAWMLVSGGAMYALLRSGTVSVTTQTPPPDAGILAVAGYDAAVTQLEQALTVNRAQLDTATVRVLEKNLAIIDRAIAEARHALAADPASQYLNHHLARTMQRKLELLRRANALAAAQT